MSEQNVDELAVLRQTNAELVAKLANRSVRITELETVNATLTMERDAALTAHRAVTLDAPVRQLAESLSSVPDIWLEQVAKRYRFEMVDGKLNLLSLDGKPVIDKTGKTVEATREGLIGLLIKSDDAAIAKTFGHIMSSTLASGGGTVGNTYGAISTNERKQEAPKPTKLSLGLR